MTAVKEYGINELIRQKKKQAVKLHEIEDYTIQLAQALDCKDNVSIKMVLSMRQEPILRIEEIDEEIKTWLGSLPEKTAIKYNELLEGSEPESPEESALSEQVKMNRKLLERIVELDKRLSIRMGGKRSYYKTMR